ncbi:uncharacterized protein LOC34618267, partial [Cyclospora cayetanensis]|uniref:Uncharacterized protein LOC34618267 n=1 Tax=Cyclospora cayetanensis TaxID=88456 RepID=A0A6P6S3U4_9EIME
SSTSGSTSGRTFSTDARVIYLNSTTRRRSVVHAGADLPPLFIVPRLRQLQPLLQSLSSSSSSTDTYMPSPLAINLKHLIQRRRTAKRSNYHPQLLPVPPPPAFPPSTGVAAASPPLPQSAAAAAAAVGQQQLQQQQLQQLQDSQLLQLHGEAPLYGLGFAGRNVVALGEDADAADAVSPTFAAVSSLERVAVAALTRWKAAAEAPSPSSPSPSSSAAADRDDQSFWKELCDRLYASRDVMPLTSLATVLRLICCRYLCTEAAASPYFLRHFASFPHLPDSSLPPPSPQQLQHKQQRLPSQRPVAASLLLPLTREFIDDAHCLSAAAAADVAAVYAVCNACSVDLLQLLLRRSVDTWLLPESELVAQRQQLQQVASSQQRQQVQLFASKPDAMTSFSPHEFAVFCSAVQHLLKQAQPLLQRQAQERHQQQAQERHQQQAAPLLPLEAAFFRKASAFLLRCTDQQQKDAAQQQAALGSLAALAGDVLQTQPQQQDTELFKACVELLRAADIFVPRRGAARDTATHTTKDTATDAAVVAFCCKETARLMACLNIPDTHGSPSTTPRTNFPGATALHHMLLQAAKLLQQQHEHLESGESVGTAHVSAPSMAAAGRLQYVALRRAQVPAAETLQLMRCVGDATAAAAQILMQPALKRRLGEGVHQQSQLHAEMQRLQQQQCLEKASALFTAPQAAEQRELQAAARQLVETVVSVITARGSSLLPSASDACRALLLLWLAAAEKAPEGSSRSRLLAHKTAQQVSEQQMHRCELNCCVSVAIFILQDLIAEIVRRFAEISQPEKQFLSQAVSVLGIRPPKATPRSQSCSLQEAALGRLSSFVPTDKEAQQLLARQETHEHKVIFPLLLPVCRWKGVPLGLSGSRQVSVKAMQDVLREGGSAKGGEKRVLVAAFEALLARWRSVRGSCAL